MKVLVHSGRDYIRRRALKKLEIAYLGHKGHSELAARVLFGHMVDLVPCYSLEEVLERGERGESDIFLPVENSIEELLDAPDLLVTAKVKIAAEISVL